MSAPGRPKRELLSLGGTARSAKGELMSGPTIAVIDIGKTSAKVLTLDRAGEVRQRHTCASQASAAAPYPHIDVEPMFQWVLDALGEVAAHNAIDTIVCTAHGAAAALIADDHLAMPVLDYEAVPPRSVDRDYDRIAPRFAETLSPRLPAGLNLGRQLFWQQTAFPAEFARVQAILTYPQYWAWRLCGVAASEISSLGAHTDLWDPRHGQFSSLAGQRGWDRLFAPLRAAWEPLGTLRPEMARAIGVPAACRVLCGVHDSNAALLRCVAASISGTAMAVVSTGTWFICFRPGGDLDRLDGARDMLANVAPDGTPLACARFMGGRECEAIAGGGNLGTANVTDLRRLIASGAMAMPSFVDLGGPFPGRSGAVIGGAGLTGGERAALAIFYAALVTDLCLDLLDAPADLAVLGPFAGNGLYPAILAALKPERRVVVDTSADATAIGAGWLAARGSNLAAFGPPLRPAVPVVAKGLIDHARRWRERVAA